VKKVFLVNDSEGETIGIFSTFKKAYTATIEHLGNGEIEERSKYRKLSQKREVWDIRLKEYHIFCIIQKYIINSKEKNYEIA